MRRLIALSVLVLCALPAGSGAGGKPHSGLYGKLTKGPVAPTCRPRGHPCYVSAGRATLRFLRNHKVVARAHTTKKGNYRIALAPGRYGVRTSVGRGNVRPGTVRVRKNTFSHVNFRADTGIRPPT